jgi:hypothetical protein
VPYPMPYAGHIAAALCVPFPLFPVPFLSETNQHGDLII